MKRTYILRVAVVSLTLFAWSTVSIGDTLFKDKTALAIGHGKKIGERLHWTDCYGKNPEDYAAPPYWIDAADNCSLSPYGFGLVIPNTNPNKATWTLDAWTSATVRDTAFLKKLFPDAKVGDSMMVYREKDSIKFKYDGKLQEIKYRYTAP